VRNQESYIKSVQITDNVIFEGFEPRIWDNFKII
jgi:hypothetical protein